MPTVILQELHAQDLTDRREIEMVGSEQGRLLRFKNAVLARAEVNKNQDELNDENITELAASLPLMALDLEHRPQDVVGFFTDARAVMEEGRAALSTDGIIFADRFPDVADDVVRGAGKLSIEATAAESTCSICGETFGSEDAYCRHLATVQAKRASGARRKFKNMAAAGGGVTRNPAGTQTTFDRNRIRFMAALVESEPIATNSEIVVTAGTTSVLLAAAVSCLTEAEYALWSGANFSLDELMPLAARVLSPAARDKLPDSDFALVQHKNGTKIRRFPVHDAAHARNALSRLSQAKGLSDSERAQVRRKAEEVLNDKPVHATEGLQTPFGGAERAAQALFATFANDVLPFTPQLNTYRPVLSPLLFVQNPAFVDEIVNRVKESLEPKLHPAPVVETAPSDPAPKGPGIATADTPVATPVATAAGEVPVAEAPAAETTAAVETLAPAETTAAADSETLEQVQKIVSEKLGEVVAEGSTDGNPSDEEGRTSMPEASAVAASTQGDRVGLVGFAWDTPTQSKSLKATW